MPRKGIERTIVFKVQYVPGGKDMVTVWLIRTWGRGATEARQMESLTTKFAANASFNQIRLRHGGERGRMDVQRDGHCDVVQRFCGGRERDKIAATRA